MKLRRFNAAGIERFAAYLDALETEPTRLAPREILSDESLTVLTLRDTEVPSQTFATRFAAARVLDELIRDAGIMDADRDIGLWAWLTLFYFDSTCPSDRAGLREPGDRPRYIPDPGNFRRYYRHLMAGPWMVYRSHHEAPERAMALLCQPVDSPGEIVESIASRIQLVSNPSIVKLVTRLYFDSATKRVKKGAGNKSTTPGSVRRLVTVLSQFDLTWDLYAMSDDELFGLLPGEFTRFAMA